MHEAEREPDRTSSRDDNTRYEFFELMQRSEPVILGFRASAWGYPPSKAGLLLQSELYSEAYRRNFWATAYEQTHFSHQERLIDGRMPYSTIEKPLLTCAGVDDVGSHGVMDVYNPARSLATRTGIGERRWMNRTSHEIAGQPPFHLADVVASFFTAIRTL